MRIITVLAALGLLSACGGADTGDAGSASSAARGGADFAALAQMSRDEPVATETFLDTCKVFAAEVDSLFHNEGEPNPMEVIRAQGADTFCACVEADTADYESRLMEDNGTARNSVTRYMAHKVAQACGEDVGRPATSLVMGYGQRVDSCYKDAAARYAG